MIPGRPPGLPGGPGGAGQIDVQKIALLLAQLYSQLKDWGAVLKFLSGPPPGAGPGGLMPPGIAGAGPGSPPPGRPMGPPPSGPGPGGPPGP